MPLRMEKQISPESINIICESLIKNGFVRVKSVIPKDLIEHVKEWLAMRESPDSCHDGDPFHGQALVINNLHAEELFFWQLIAHPVITQICCRLLNQYSYKNSEGYSLTGSSIRATYGPSEPQQLHIDSNLPGCNHILSLQFCVPIDPFTEQSGATQVVANSQHKKSYPPERNHLNNDDSKLLTLLLADPGDLLVFNAGIWHGASSKSTQSRRAAIFLNYSRWFLKQSYDIANNIPPHILEHLNLDQLRIAGTFFQPPLDSSENRGRKSDFPVIRNYTTQ